MRGVSGLDIHDIAFEILVCLGFSCYLHVKLSWLFFFLSFFHFSETLEGVHFMVLIQTSCFRKLCLHLEVFKFWRSCFGVSPSPHVTSENRLGLWGHLTEFWKDAIHSLLTLGFLPVTARPVISRALVILSRSHLFSSVQLLTFQNTQQIPPVTDFPFCLFLKCEALGPNC